MKKNVKKTIATLTENFKEHVEETGESLLEKFEDKFDELKREIDTRFGQRNQHEVFRALPPPIKMTMSLTEALQSRRSERRFSNEPLTDQELSTLLWAADGITRKNGRRTTPSAMDWREVEIYVLKANGIWLWVPERRGLLFCDIRDVRSECVLAQPQILSAPVHFIFVSNTKKTQGLLLEAGTKILKKLDKDELLEKVHDSVSRSRIIDVGVKIQAVYLAASALNIACLARTGFDPERVSKALKLSKEQQPIAAQTLGYRAESIFDQFA